ncbi:MAG: FHA domain-containing protein [Planctomycetes bacterium]|nr:FHA domain-containing protein [Planctomycetota bacterium]
MRLVYTRGEEEIAFPLDEGETFVGRKANCDLHFDDASLSKRHTRFVREGGALRVYDAGSRNGTLHNGELVPPEGSPVSEGDTIQCGQLVFVARGIAGEEFEVLEDSTFGQQAALPVALAVASGEVAGANLGVLPVLEDEPDLPATKEPLARLKLVAGGEAQTWELDGETITIGSKDENLVCLTCDGVSRYHAELTFEDGVWLIKDLGSRNGIFVAGEQVDIHELAPGDEIQIGNARLRFELLTPGVFDGVKEVLVKLRADPLGTLKTDGRARMGLAGAISAMILMFLAFRPGSAPPQIAEQASLAWCERATQLLSKGDFAAAEKYIRKSTSEGTIRGPHRRLASQMAKVSRQWHKAKRASSFQWEKASELLDQIREYKSLPETTKAWAEAQSAWVTRNKAASDALDRAAAIARRAAQLGSHGRIDDGVKTFREAFEIYEGIAPDTAFHGAAQAQLAQMRGLAFQTILSEVRRRTDIPSPDWDEALIFLNSAVEFAATDEQKANLTRMRLRCELNRHDESLYVRAVEIAQQHDVKNYPRAINYLQSVRKEAQIYPDARAYLDWIDADQKVRFARQAYDLGSGERALRMLQEVLKYDVLGPEARSSVTTRKRTWEGVINAWETGMRLYHEGHTREAKERFRHVLNEEPSQDNRYHKLARDQLNHIVRVESQGLERNLRYGLKALAYRDYHKAWRAFNRVRDDPNRKDRDLKKIRDAVSNLNRDLRLLYYAKRTVDRNQTDKYLGVYYTLQLLSDWLPRGKDKREAAQYYGRVADHLNRINKR